MTQGSMTGLDGALDAQGVALDKNHPPRAHGVFKPNGHVVIAFPDARRLSVAHQALRNDAHAPAGSITVYSDAEMRAQSEADLENASDLAAVGQELNLIKSLLALAREGHHFLVVESTGSRARQVAAIAQRHGAVRAQAFGALMIEELIVHPQERRQAPESPDTGLDVSTPRATEVLGSR